MKILIISAILLLSLCHHNKTFSQDTIHWSPAYKLKWSDFQGMPDSSSEKDDAALCSVKINYTFKYNKDSFSYKIFCFFRKTDSWTLDTVNTSLLKHEQIHFDIAQLFAQKLKSKFKTYKFSYSSTSIDLKKVFNEVMADFKRFEKQYDDETQHSKNKIAQKKWETLIENKIQAGYNQTVYE